MQSALLFWLKSYGIAVLFSGFALFISLLLSPLAERSTVAIFVAAVALSAYFGDRKSGLLATLLCGSASSYFFLRPIYSPWIATLEEGIEFGLFIGVSLLITSLNTARKQTESNLHESESRFRLMVEGVKDYAIFMLDPQGYITSWNAGAERLKGYQADEIVGQHFSRFYPPEAIQQGKPNQVLQTAVTDGQFHEEGERVRKDGSRFWANVLVTALRDENGTLLGFSKVVQDITERQRAKDAQRNSEEQLRRAIVEAPLPICLHAEDGTILQLSRTWTELSGYCPEDIPTIVDWTEKVYGERKEIVRETIDRLYHINERVAEGEFTITTRSGASRIWDFYSAPVGRLPDGRRQIISMALDVTERKQAEEAAQIRTRQQAAIAQLGQRALSGIEGSTLIDEAVALVAQAMSVEYCGVLKLLPQDNVLLLRAGFGWPLGLVGEATVEAGIDSLGEYVLRSHQPVIVANLLTETRFDQPPLLHNYGVVSSISIAIGGATHPWGLLGAYTTRQRAFTSNDINFIQSVANILTETIERKRSAQALQESYTLLQAVIEGTTDAIFAKDRKGCFILANSTTARIMGRPVADILGKDDTDIFSADVAAVLQETDRHIMTTGMGQTVEEQLPEAGRMRTYLTTKDPYRDGEGNVIGLIGIARDITERKEAEKALLRFAQRLEALQEIDHAILRAESPQALARAALSRMQRVVPYQQAAIVLFNLETRDAQILVGSIDGETEDSMISIDDLFFPKADRSSQPVRYIDNIARLEPRSALLERQLAEGYRSVLSVSLVIENNVIGELFLFAYPIAAFDSEHQTIAHEVANQLAIAIQQAQLRQQLQTYAATLEQQVAERTIALQEANDDLESFTYSVSHDLRAPLRAMEGLGQALLEDYPEQFNTEGLDFVHRIVGAAQQMTTLIQDLLSYSRLSRAEMRLRSLELTPIVADVLASLEADLQAHPVQIIVENPLPAVMGHYRTLVQMLTNLMTNAIKFVAPDVQPQVRVWAEERVDDNGDRVWIRLWIEDNGIGIEPQHQDRIFQVFERLHGVETYPGTGVGLAIVRKGVERMGGQVGVQSQIQQGSRFWLELPKAS